MDRDFIIGQYFPQQPFLKSNMYEMVWKGADRYARSIQRKLAEGPTVLIPDNYYGVVELWPLVIEEGEENSLSR